MHESCPQYGVQLHQPWSLPLIARKERFAYPKPLVWELAQSLAEKTKAIAELCRVQSDDGAPSATEHPTGLSPEAVIWQARYMRILEQYTTLRNQVSLASRSRWLALGHRLGVGPKFTKLP